MRRMALSLLLVLTRAGAACGGGGGGDTGTSDTGALDTTTSETVTEPAVTGNQDGEAFQIRIPKAGQPIGPQSPEDRVVEVQTAMGLLGYKVGQPDGIYGQKTLNAVRNFQRKQKLTADGLVGAKTARAINKALRKANAQA